MLRGRKRWLIFPPRTTLPGVRLSCSGGRRISSRAWSATSASTSATTSTRSPSAPSSVPRHDCLVAALRRRRPDALADAETDFARPTTLWGRLTAEPDLVATGVVPKWARVDNTGASGWFSFGFGLFFQSCIPSK